MPLSGSKCSVLISKFTAHCPGLLFVGRGILSVAAGLTTLRSSAADSPLHWLDGLLVEVRQFLEDTLVNAPKAPTTVIPSLALDDSVTPVAEDAKVEVHGGLFVVR